MKVVVHANASDLAAAAAGRMSEIIAGTDSTIGLAGGSTPRTAYEILAGMDVAWERTRLWLSDERWVPADHPDSNGRMVTTALRGAPATILIPRFGDDPVAAASAYESVLHRELANRRNLVMLGMGSDGHTASLFPGSAALRAPADRWFVENWVPELGVHRLTATRALISQADLVMVLVSGVSKSTVLAKVLEGPPDRFPIQFVTELDSVWLVDEAAASHLTAITIE